MIDDEINKQSASPREANDNGDIYYFRDDSESEKAYRSWKKPIMILWNEIAAHKYASLFLRPITDEKAPGYHSVVYR